MWSFNHESKWLEGKNGKLWVNIDIFERENSEKDGTIQWKSRKDSCAQTPLHFLSKIIEQIENKASAKKIPK